MENDLSENFKIRSETIEFFSAQYLKTYDKISKKQVLFFERFSYFFDKLKLKFNDDIKEYEGKLSPEQLKEAREINAQIEEIMELYNLLSVNYSRKRREFQNLNNFIKIFERVDEDLSIKYAEILLNNINTTSRSYKNMGESISLIQDAKGFFSHILKGNHEKEM